MLNHPLVIVTSAVWGIATSLVTLYLLLRIHLRRPWRTGASIGLWAYKRWSAVGDTNSSDLCPENGGQTRVLKLVSGATIKFGNSCTQDHGIEVMIIPLADEQAPVTQEQWEYLLQRVAKARSVLAVDQRGTEKSATTADTDSRYEQTLPTRVSPKD